VRARGILRELVLRIRLLLLVLDSPLLHPRETVVSLAAHLRAAQELQLLSSGPAAATSPIPEVPTSTPPPFHPAPPKQPCTRALRASL